MKAKKTGFVLGLVPFVLGILLSALTAIPYFHGARSAVWPAAQGTILQAEVRAYHGRARGWGSFTGYNFELRYVYAVEGRRYESSVLSYVRISPEQFRASYRKGEAVRVYYNPRNPQDAVLLPGGQSPWGNPIFIVGILLMAWGVVSTARRLSRR